MKFLVRLPFFRLLLAFSLLTLGGCGYHLRGQADLSFHSLYMKKSGASSVARDLGRLLKFNGVKVVDIPEQAEMQLELMSEGSTQQILSLSGGGTVSEYLLHYHVTFRTRPAASELWGPAQTIEQQREYTYDNALILAKEAEAEQLNNDMRAESAREIMRRLSNQNPGKPDAAN